MTKKKNPPPAGNLSRTDTAPQSRAIQALVSVVEDLTVEREQGGLVRSTLEHVIEALGIDGGVTFLPDPEGELAPEALVKLPAADRETAAELARDVYVSGEPLVHETLAGGWYALTPLTMLERRLGVMALRAARSDASPPSRELLEALGKQIGTGLENARQYAELRASSERVSMLNRINASLATSREMSEVIPAFAKELADLEGFDRLACAIVNEGGDYIEVFGYPEETTWGLGAAIPVVGSGPGFVVLNSESVLQRDLLHNHRFIEDMRLLEEGIRSYVLLPLRSGGRGIGVLALGSSRVGTYDETTLVRLQPLADSVALSLENVRLFQRTRELSITDELTPLYNARFFRQILERELKLVDRYNSVLSLIFVDLDRFKPINDKYGHLRGSRVLREVGFLLRSAVRETDYPARYGGDEFVVILPQTDGPSARLLAEKLRSLVESHTFLQEEGINATIGLSLGIATYPTDVASKDGLIRLADERMYADKGDRRTQ
jgi:diguanylate cyclase (GGDEF)-like protein